MTPIADRAGIKTNHTSRCSLAVINEKALTCLYNAFQESSMKYVFYMKHMLTSLLQKSKKIVLIIMVILLSPHPPTNK